MPSKILTVKGESMNKKHLCVVTSVYVLIFVLSFALCAYAKIEWRILEDVALEHEPLGVAISRDGATLYVLGPKMVSVCSMISRKVTDTIPLQEEFTGIDISPDGETLVLANAKSKKISLVELTPVIDLDIGESPIIGKKDAPVTLFAFLDYQCPYCARVFPLLEQALEKYPEKVNLVIKHFPLQMHKSAKKAALGSLAAEKQGKYKEVSKAYFENFRKLNDDTIKSFAKDLGLDMEKFDKDFQDAKLNSIIARDAQMGRMAGVRGVPAIYINGIQLKNRSLQGISQIVEKELNKGGSAQSNADDGASPKVKTVSAAGDEASSEASAEAKEEKAICFITSLDIAPFFI